MPFADDNLIDRDTESPCNKTDATLNRSLVGTILHIADMTRPDIQYPVNRLTRHVRNPSENAMLSLKHLVRYSWRTKSASLHFPNNISIELTASSDSSWGSITSSKGTSRILFSVGNTPVAWWSKLQSVTAQSTCEAEYAALKTLAIAAQ